jgi:hypothetical protein
VTGTPLKVQIYWDDVIGIGIRAANASDDITVVSFITDADTQNIALAVDIGIGNRNGEVQFIGDYADNGLPKTWSSAQAAGWL